MDGSYLTNINKISNDFINLGNVAGLIKLQKVETGEVILYTDDNFREAGMNHVEALSLLSLFFNQGIETTSFLASDGGYYPQKFNNYPVVINNDGYDKKIFEEYFKKINKMCSSHNTNINRKGRNISNMLSAYRKALLLYPKYYEESYLNLVRIVDANRPSMKKDSNSWIFPHKAISVLPKRFVNSFYNKLIVASEKIKYIKEEHINVALKFFIKNKEFISGKVKNIQIYKESSFKFLYAVLFACYEYRNKYLHDSFPFPKKITSFHRDEGNKPLNYLGGSFGEGYCVSTDPFKSIDIHKCLNISSENKKFKRTKRNIRSYDKLYILLPTWYLLNLITREVLFYQLKKFK